MAIEKELLDQLLAGRDPHEVFAKDGLLDDLKKALSGTDVAAIKEAHERLLTASQSFSQKLYEAASREQQASAGAQTTAADDDEVVDAEIVDDERSA